MYHNSYILQHDKAASASEALTKQSMARRLALLRALLGTAEAEASGQRAALCHNPPQFILGCTTSPGLSVWVCVFYFFLCVRAVYWDRAALRMGPFYNLLTLRSCLQPLLATVNGISVPWKVTRWHSSCCSKGPRVVLWKAAERIGEDCDLQRLISGMSFGACLKRMQTFLPDSTCSKPNKAEIPIRFSTVKSIATRQKQSVFFFLSNLHYKGTRGCFVAAELNRYSRQAVCLTPTLSKQSLQPVSEPSVHRPVASAAPPYRMLKYRRCCESSGDEMHLVRQ